MDWVLRELNRLREESLFRERRQIENLKDFCSNDYLGLRDHPEVVGSAVEALKRYGLGSGASQLVSGYTEVHRRLEEELARFKGTPACVLFGSGYLANVGAIPVLSGEGDLIVSDELNHASLIDGCRFSKADRRIFRHRDYEDLERILKAERGKYRRALIVTDSVFSMDGDLADLKALYELSENYECILYIDDAHATGTIGEGRGSLREFGLPWKEHVVVMGTLSKALGSYGAFVCASAELTELLVNRARSLIFTTSLPPSLCAGALKSLELIEKNPDMVTRLRTLSERIYRELKALPFKVHFHGTPIIPLIVGEEAKALNISRKLLEEGIFLQAIRYPTVPRGSARLRLTVSLRYSEEDLELLIEKLKSVVKDTG
ncbi:8-amino-7-oxononanoate synthase [Hydrogenivirga sp. 128-5-R1-1]|uniref:8-amino-7-oxononanoate synthase n=1 Tax=Hydrogenivirga sp. 128-5-R1-1 TaxID=392423 RepID=UPI00015EF0B4|nr:8-amino-7-oxononanoate synthase [Hydrogenivirga sp. 128-5-R1-1]EDP74699.1 8-amino-7-oxononanoate synthase [Hydrogenivirga sp. 128-5-R1-1]